MFNWVAPENRLYHISKRQINQFLNLGAIGEVYGFGCFCDSFNGSDLLVANTESFYRTRLGDFEDRFGSTDAEAFRWEIGNWEYPAGLFPSASPEQRLYDLDWKEYEKIIAHLEEDDKQDRLEEIALRVLKRLVCERIFLSATGVEGYTILGPEDAQRILLEKKRRIDVFLKVGSD